MSKVMRFSPEVRSVPMQPIKRPSSTMAMALGSDPLARTTAPIRPTVSSATYSAGPNRIAISARGGPARAITTAVTQPANNEPSAAMASAAPARPCRAISYPSRQVTTAELLPGSLTRMAVVDPPYWAP